MLAFSSHLTSILCQILCILSFLFATSSDAFIWIGAGISPCFGCGPFGPPPIGPPFAPPPFYRPGFGGYGYGGGYGGYRPESGGCCCQPGCPSQACCTSCQTTTCCQTTTTCCQQQSCGGCQLPTCGGCQQGGCGGGSQTAILQPVPNDKELPTLVAPMPAESPSIIYVALPAGHGETGDKTSDKGDSDVDKGDEHEKKTTKRHTTMKNEEGLSTTSHTDEPKMSTVKTSARDDVETEEVTFEPNQSQIEVEPSQQRTTISKDTDYFYEDEVLSEQATPAPPKLIVADVSARSQKLVPIDLFEKRYNLLRRLKEHSTNNFKHFSAPSFTSSSNYRRAPNTKCNHQKLYRVMSKAMVNDLSIAKRLIRKATEISFRDGTKFDVLCAKRNFSYSIYADQYCEASRGNTTCFAFRFL